MCDFATTDPKAGGRLYLWWNGGFYVCAEFTSLERDKTIAPQGHYAQIRSAIADARKR
jgi:hypothetical protein